MHVLQDCATPQQYLQQRLNFKPPEVATLTSDYSNLETLPVATLHRNVQAMRGLGRSVGQVKALVQKCPPLLETDFDGLLSFFYSYGASPRVRHPP